MRICLYVSDHGFGHATRCIALARSLIAASRGALSLEIVNHRAHGLLRRALGGLRSVRVVDRPTDVGFACREDRLALDPGPTALAVWRWISGWKSFVAEEAKRLEAAPPNLVISDVAPEPLLAAEKLGIPSIVASNFTWVDQYAPFLRADLLAPIRGSYALAERGHAYAMSTSLAGLRQTVPAGLVTREPSRAREEIRRILDVGSDEPLVHIGLGWSSDTSAFASDLDTAGWPPDVRLLVSANLAGQVHLGGSHREPIPIPGDDTEAQDYIAACDLVIAKAGYGTVSEAIAGRVPILALPVEGSTESQVIARSVEDLGIGVAHPRDEVVKAPILDEGVQMLSELDRYRDAYARLPAEFARGGADRLARAILEAVS